MEERTAESLICDIYTMLEASQMACQPQDYLRLVKTANILINLIKEKNI